MNQIVTAIVLFLVSAVACADVGVDYFLKISNGTKLEKHSMEMYVGGVANGYLNANAILSAKNQPQLFCYEGNIDTKKAYELTLQAVHESKTTNTIEVLLLLKLISHYPC